MVATLRYVHIQNWTRVVDNVGLIQEKFLGISFFYKKFRIINS